MRHPDGREIPVPFAAAVDADSDPRRTEFRDAEHFTIGLSGGILTVERLIARGAVTKTADGLALNPTWRTTWDRIT